MERLRDMMNASDNVMAESIGREVAAELNRPQSFDGAVQAVLSALDGADIDTGGARLFDSSGLSVDDRLTAETLDDVVNVAAGSDQPDLRPLVDLLPIAGGSGTLSNRYLDTDAGRSAAGFLRAKTGSLTGTNSLAGIITDASGRVLTFALISNNCGTDRPHRARQPRRHAAVVRMQHMSPHRHVHSHRRPRRRLEVRGRCRSQAGTARPGRNRIHPPPGHRATGRSVPQRRTAGARGHRAQRGRRDPRGPHRGPPAVDPRGHPVDADDDGRWHG